MNDDMTGDEVYQPDPGADVQEDDVVQLDSGDTFLFRDLDDPLDEGGYAPPEYAPEVYRHGVVDGEQGQGESLDERLAEEVPDQGVPEGDGLGDTWDTDGELLDDEVGGARAGRLVAPGEGSHDESDGMIASDVGIDGAAASAEEAAVHLIPEPDEY